MSARDDRVLAYVRERPGCSFAELSRAIDGFRTSPGEGGYVVELAPNVAVWFDLTAEWCETMLGLLNDKRLVLRRCSVLLYALDGAVPSVPIARPNKTYKRIHWMPVVMDVAERND